MSDKKLEMMLAAANTLTADDLDCLRNCGRAATAKPAADDDGAAELPAPDATAVDADEAPGVEDSPDAVSNAPTPDPRAAVRARRCPPAHAPAGAPSRGEYERQRTRESKVSTECIGHERERHDWWPVGTELVGEMGPDVFTATVVVNAQVKSGRSILITSGPASGKVCLTPTRAAMEATEAYRQTHNLGRGGGVTNGWTFWQPTRHAT
jgi:hypothetical protein